MCLWVERDINAARPRNEYLVHGHLRDVKEHELHVEKTAEEDSCFNINLRENFVVLFNYFEVGMFNFFL